MDVDMNETNVLLVEDDVNVRTAIKGMLREMGISNIQEATDGVKALEYLDDHPDVLSLIVCDWNMPNKTGIGLLKDVRQAYPILPFLMVTARADKDSVLDAKNADVTGYICKPFSFEDFRKKVSTMLKIPM